MFKIFVKFKCFDGKRNDFVKRVKEEGILDLIRGEDGCHLYEYYYSDERENELLLIEMWESPEHQQIHIKTPHMDKLRSFKNDYIYETEIGEFFTK